jgi:hypothetical protein
MTRRTGPLYGYAVWSARALCAPASPLPDDARLSEIVEARMKALSRREIVATREIAIPVKAVSFYSPAIAKTFSCSPAARKNRARLRNA